MLRKAAVIIALLATTAPVQVQAATTKDSWCAAEGHSFLTPWYWFLRPCQSISGSGNS
jgi:hypothetical protein